MTQKWSGMFRIFDPRLRNIAISSRLRTQGYQRGPMRRDGDEVARAGFRDQALVMVHKALGANDWTSVVYDPAGAERVDLRWTLTDGKQRSEQVKSYESEIKPAQAQDWCQGLATEDGDEHRLVLIAQQLSPTVSKAGSYFGVLIDHLAKSRDILTEATIARMALVVGVDHRPQDLYPALHQAISLIEGKGGDTKWSRDSVRTLLNYCVLQAVISRTNSVTADTSVERVMIARSDDSIIELAKYHVRYQGDVPMRLKHRLEWRESSCTQLLHASTNGGQLAMGRCSTEDGADPFWVEIETEDVVTQGEKVTFEAIVRRYGVVRSIGPQRAIFDPLKKTSPPQSVTVVLICDAAQTFDELEPPTRPTSQGQVMWKGTTSTEYQIAAIWTPEHSVPSATKRAGAKDFISTQLASMGCDLSLVDFD